MLTEPSLCCFSQEEALLPTYLELYDIVLTGDSNMDVVNAVVAAMLNIRHDDTCTSQSFRK